MKRKISLYILLSIIVIASLIYSVNVIIWNITLNDLKREGIPTTPQEYVDKYYKPVPEKDNAAPNIIDAKMSYVEAKNLKHIVYGGYLPVPLLDQNINSLLIPPANKHLNNNKQIFEIISKIKNKKYARFHYKWMDYDIDIKHPSYFFRSIQRLLSLKLIVNLHDKKFSESPKLLKEMNHTALLAQQSPDQVGQLISYACNVMFIKSLQNVICKQQLSKQDLLFFKNALHEREKKLKDNYQKFWYLNIIYNINLAKHIEKQIIPDSPAYLFGFKIIFYLSGLNNGHIKMIDFNKEMSKIPLENYNQNISKIDSLCAKAKQVMCLDLISVADADIYLKATRTLAINRCAETACAIMLYQQKYKKLPTKLKALVPEFIETVTIDPFDGKELGYYRGKFKVDYSIPQLPENKLPDYNEEIHCKTETIEKQGFYVFSRDIDGKDDIKRHIAVGLRKRPEQYFAVTIPTKNFK